MDFIYDPALVLYLPLYEPAGDALASRDQYGHLCTVTGAVWTPRGRRFDGTDDEITCGNPTVLQLTNDFTVEVWLKLNASQGALYDPVSHGHSATQGWVLQGSGASMVWQTGDGSSGHGLAFNKDLRDDVYHHLAAVKSSRSGKLTYVDAQQTNSAPSVTAALSLVPGAIVTIGDDPVVSGRNMAGIVGEVRLYSRVLTPLEIMRNFLATRWRYR